MVWISIDTAVLGIKKTGRMVRQLREQDPCGLFVTLKAT